MGFKIGVTPDGRSGGITVRLQDGRSKFYQWDENLRLVLTGVNVGDEVHFDMPGSDTPEVNPVYEIDGELICEIPNALLQTHGKFKIWVYVTDGKGSRTAHERYFTVEPRERPPDYDGLDSITYLLIDDDGNQFPGVAMEEVTLFTATANDIRKGSVAATEDGVTEGEKVIPSYNTWEGYRLIPSGSDFTLQIIASDGYDFTKFQAILCPYSGSIAGSVAAEKVAINDGVYPVQSTEQISTVTRDDETKSIRLGIRNESKSIFLMRYFTYKEVY